MAIKVRLLGIEGLSEGDKDDLEAYAFYCPYEAGLVVAQAQSLLSMYIDTVFGGTCISLEEKSFTGIDGNNPESVVRVFPNPTSEGWNIISNSDEILHYNLFDMNGILKRNGLILKGHNYLENLLPSGIYYLRIQDEKNEAFLYKLCIIH